jgi:pimeloyl-ACP methyl ester carboxylesterase
MATTVRASGIEIAYEVQGERSGRPLVLVGGLGQQLVGWHPDLVASFVRRRYRVITYDNRDVGLSTHLHHLGDPDLSAAFAGNFAMIPYTIADMAADLVGLLDGLAIDSAHLFGVSMGGMIAQTAALAFPDRVRSLTSVMSHPGDPRVRPSAEALATLLRPAAPTREAFVAAAEESCRIIGSTEFTPDVGWVRSCAGRYWDRGHEPRGVARQLAAAVAQPDRTADLAGLRIPTLVVHGTSDPLMPVLGGRLTAAAVPAAELLEIDGMGHDLPRPVWERVLDKLDDVVLRAELVGPARTVKAS